MGHQGLSKVLYVPRYISCLMLTVRIIVPMRGGTVVHSLVKGTGGFPKVSGPLHMSQDWKRA